MKLKFLPFEMVTYETKLTETEVMNRLSEVVQPGDFHGFTRIYIAEKSKPYEGKIEGYKFKIVRITDAPRANPAIIVGHVESDSDKTIIMVTIRIYIEVMFMFGLIVIVCGILGVFSITFFFYFFIMLNFHGERENAKINLQKLFEAEEV